MSAVNHPAHYNNHPSRVEAIEICRPFFFDLGNAFKYMIRFPYKGESEDLRKAIWYLDDQVSSPETTLGNIEAFIAAERNKNLKTIYQNIFSYQFEGAHPKVIWESIEILRKVEQEVRERETN